MYIQYLDQIIESEYWILTRRRPSRSSLSPTDKSSSDLSDMSELSQSLQSNESSKSNTNSMQSLSDPCPESRVDLSPINDNYSKIYSQTEEPTSSIYDCVYNTVNTRLQPIGMLSYWISSDCTLLFIERNFLGWKGFITTLCTLNHFKLMSIHD